MFSVESRLHKRRDARIGSGNHDSIRMRSWCETSTNAETAWTTMTNCLRALLDNTSGEEVFGFIAVAAAQERPPPDGSCFPRGTRASQEETEESCAKSQRKSWNCHNDTCRASTAAADTVEMRHLYERCDESGQATHLWTRTGFRLSIVRVESEGSWKSEAAAAFSGKESILLEPIPGNAHWQTGLVQEAIRGLKATTRSPSTGASRHGSTGMLGKSSGCFQSKGRCQGMVTATARIGEHTRPGRLIHRTGRICG